MKTLYEDFGIIILFLSLIYVFEIAFGDKATQGLLWLILLGMYIFNAGKLENAISKILENVNNPEPVKTGGTTVHTSSSGGVFGGGGRKF